MRDRGGFGDVEDIELMMGYPAPFVDGQFGGADVHAAVELHCVGVDHLDRQFAGQALRDRQGEIGLAGAGGSHQSQRPDGGHGVQRPTKYPTP